MNEIELKDKKMTSIFDRRTIQMLFEFYFLTLLSEYKRLSEDQRMLFKHFEREKDDEDEDEENGGVDVDEEEAIQLTAKNPTILMGNIKDMKTKTARMVGTFISIMANHKDRIFLNYETIMDKVFKSKESEKNRITDRLQNLTDEERNVDTILKINKLGVWSKGLQKGLTTYVKETYDEERAYDDKMEEIERQLKKTNKNVTDNNVDQYLEDFFEERDVDEDIEREENDLTNYLGDDMGEDYEGQEKDLEWDDWE
jgi:hypothetical protein